MDETQVLLRQLPGSARFGVVCASNQFDWLSANQTCRQLGMGWATDFGMVSLQAIHLPWVHYVNPGSADWHQSLPFIHAADSSSFSNSSSQTNAPPLSSAGLDSFGEFNRRIRLSAECKGMWAQTVTCASFECSASSVQRRQTNVRTGTPRDVLSLINLQILSPISDHEPAKECVAQLISPSWLLSSAECLE